MFPYDSRGEIAIAKNRNTFAKRARETDKRRNAEEKRASRKGRKEQQIRDKLLPRTTDDQTNSDEPDSDQAESQGPSQ